MKIALFGKNGQLGWELQHVLSGMGEVRAFGREEIDLSKPDQITPTLLAWQPTVIINSAAFTEVDVAETQTELANTINAIVPGVMAEVARKLHTVFIHFSTDYVFDGKTRLPYTEQDQTNPLNQYGRSKLMGEVNIQQAGAAYLILRTSWVYSLRGNSFVNKVLGWSRKNKILKIVDDQISSPTWARSLAEITGQLLADNARDLFNIIQGRSGIYHVAGSGYTSRYEWARQILAADPNPTEQLVQSIEPVSSREFPTPALRPLFSALNCKKFIETFGLRLPDWEITLQRAMSKNQNDNLF
jgi:dTDP-4-dehydrorhamnose reductase